jgi:hypothetical protein
MCQLAGCQVGGGGLPPGDSKVPPASGRVLAHAAAKSPPPVLAQAGVRAGRQLLVRGPSYWPLFPAAAGAGGLVLGLPTRGVPLGSSRDKLTGYAIVRLSDGRVTRLPRVHPAWTPGVVGGVLSTAAGRVIWLEADRRPGGYQWALYVARGSRSRPRLLGESRALVPSAGLPVSVGVQGQAVCWASSDDDRHWVVVRRPVAGAGLTVTARVDDLVAKCLPAGRDTLVMTQQGPPDRPVSAGDPMPGNVFDVTPAGRVRRLLKGPYSVSVAGDQVAFCSQEPYGATGAVPVEVARLAGHRLVGAHPVGPRGVAIFEWLGSRYLVAMKGSGPDSGLWPLLLIDTRTGQSRTILPAPSRIVWEGTSDGHLVYARFVPPPGPGQALDIDEFGLPRRPRKPPGA